MNYVTVFDVGRDYYAFSAAIPFVLIPVATGVALLVYRPQWRRRVTITMALVVSVGCLLVLSLWGDQLRLARALRSGAVTWVEGTITDFSPGSAQGHAQESFVVDSTRFTFDPNAFTAAYHKGSGDGGALHEGLNVRMAHLNGQIVLIDTAVQLSSSNSGH